MLARKIAKGGASGQSADKKLEDEYRELNKQKTQVITKMKSNEEIRRRDMLRAQKLQEQYNQIAAEKGKPQIAVSNEDELESSPAK